jgi:ribosome maturation factor RimP
VTTGSTNPSANPVIERVRTLVSPIASDLGLDVYDVEQRGGTIRVTLDTPPGSAGGVDLDQIALATRLISRELDHEDPVPGRYTLEVTSPGVERTLRTPEHFRREVGKTVNIRLADVGNEQRRIEGVLVSADDTTATVRVADDASGEPVDRVVVLAQVDRARTVFVWGPQPKPGGPKHAGRRSSTAPGSKQQGASAGAKEPAPAGRTTGGAAARTSTEEHSS